MICPHAAIQTKVFDPAALVGAPEFSLPCRATEDAPAGLHYAVQVAPEDCTGCGLCVEVCPAKDRLKPRRKALVSEPLSDHREAEREAFAFFETLPPADLDALPLDKRTAALHLPLFEFSGACTGCGETPYIRLLTQLFGDHLLIANATGCSSIYGGNLPTTPYTTNADGRGPAWSNSLFEDNAEFGLGMRLGVDVRAARARSLLEAPGAAIARGARRRAARAGRRRRVARGAAPAWTSSNAARGRPLARGPGAARGGGGARAAQRVDRRRRRLGLRHRLRRPRPRARLAPKVNVLVLDTEVYSNTGGQQSKATPLGASAKFAPRARRPARRTSASSR
jgi:pyruvate-ferredoxin/flavodoxin oxidoreductase